MRVVAAMSSDIVLLLCVISLAVLIPSGGEGVRIKELKVPDVILNGTEKPAYLDCEYVLDTPASTSGLVVKWFFNNHPAPVYQWIYNKKPQDLGVLKGKVNLGYRTTAEESTMYRGIEIITPTTELSGEYKCLVSTFDKEDSKSKKMIVYVPGKDMELKQEKIKDDGVNITCQAEGVFPEPSMDIKALESSQNGHFEVSSKKQNNGSLYDIRAYLNVKDVDLVSPTTFQCELSIPDAKYTERKNLVYYPGPPTTHSAFDDLAEPLPTSGASGSTLSSSLFTLVTLSLALVSCSSL